MNLIRINRDPIFVYNSITDFQNKIGSRFSFQNRSLISKIKSLIDRKTVKNKKHQAERKIGSRFFSKNRSPFSKIKPGSENFFQIDPRFLDQNRSLIFKIKSRSGFHFTIKTGPGMVLHPALVPGREGVPYSGGHHHGISTTGTRCPLPLENCRFIISCHGIRSKPGAWCTRHPGIKV